jgi:hypothetical protein
LRQFARRARISERGVRTWFRCGVIPGNLELALEHVRLLAELRVIVASTKPGKMVRKGPLQTLCERYDPAPPVAKAEKVKPPKPARKAAKPKRKKWVRTYDPAVRYEPPRVETAEQKMRRILDSVPCRLTPIKPPDGSLF